ncbi:hypothetical protein BdWA1_000344 [Babesia duncani]|uniref:Uncharacterized protein n=1 Tax=Babesia duncani TaxID=323732 RepID=A0AAD9PM05_9APIC|nr:hypothetical protein BdWA1_000344 [Babesia duncani]
MHYTKSGRPGASLRGILRVPLPCEWSWSVGPCKSLDNGQNGLVAPGQCFQVPLVVPKLGACAGNLSVETKA